MPKLGFEPLKDIVRDGAYRTVTDGLSQSENELLFLQVRV
jgi:hypothetical protein